MAHPQIVELPKFDFNTLPRRRKLQLEAELLEHRRDFEERGLTAKEMRRRMRSLKWQIALDPSLAEKYDSVIAAINDMDRTLKQGKSIIAKALSQSSTTAGREPNTAQPRQARRAATATRSGSDSDPPGLPPLGVHWTQTGLKLSDLTQASQFGGRA